MKALSISILFVSFFSAAASAQSLSNSDIFLRIKKLNAGKEITLTYDRAGGTSKIMAVSDNFSDGESGRAGLKAMNFAAGFFYAGETLPAPPDSRKLSFWAMAKKACFAEDHRLAIIAGGDVLELGDGRYSAKPDRQMEYLNYDLTRDAIRKIAGSSNVRMRLGKKEFSFTPAQLRILSDLLSIIEP